MEEYYRGQVYITYQPKENQTLLDPGIRFVSAQLNGDELRAIILASEIAGLSEKPMTQPNFAVSTPDKITAWSAVKREGIYNAEDWYNTPNSAVVKLYEEEVGSENLERDFTDDGFRKFYNYDIQFAFGDEEPISVYVLNAKAVISAFRDALDWFQIENYPDFIVRVLDSEGKEFRLRRR